VGLGLTELSGVEKIIARLLVDSAINKSGNFSYSEITDILEREHGEKINPHYGLSKPLGNIATLCNELNLPLLSVRVQYKNDTSGGVTRQNIVSIDDRITTS